MRTCGRLMYWDSTIALGNWEFSYLMKLIADCSHVHCSYIQQKLKYMFEKVFIFLPFKLYPKTLKPHVNMYEF